MTTSQQLDLHPLRSTVAGSVTAPGDRDWDAARRAWNLAVDQRPAAVVHATSVADVAAAIGFARERGLRVAPQGTGHGAAAMAALDDTLLLKTAAIDAVAIDPAARRARVGAGALWGDVATAAGAHGLAALHGSSRDVGVVGYTLGGGIGWLSRLHGLASESVTATELVTADGEQRRAEAGDPLFWALRGGGGSFGVVTAMEFDLHPLADVWGGSLFWPMEAGAALLHAYREWAPALPDEVSSIFRFLRLPPLPEVPEALRGVPVVDVCVAFAGGDAESGEELVRPLRDAAAPLFDTFASMRAPALASLHGDPEQPVPGIGHHALLRELTPEAVETLVRVAGHDSGSPLLGVELRQLGGALARRTPGHGALGAIDAEYVLYGIGVPTTPEVGRRVQEHLDAVVAAVAPWSTGGSYLNFADQPGTDRSTAFDAETYAGLRSIKAAYDPDGLLHANHPIPAAG